LRAQLEKITEAAKFVLSLTVTHTKNSNNSNLCNYAEQVLNTIICKGLTGTVEQVFYNKSPFFQNFAEKS
jgi:hypothetical protein